MFLLWALKSTCNIFWIHCDVINFTYFLATCFWCLFLITCFPYSLPRVLFVMCLDRFYTHSFLNYSLFFSEASSYWTSPSKEIPMGDSLGFRPAEIVWSQSCVYVKSAVHKAMYCQSLSHPLKQITPFRDECSSTGLTSLPLPDSRQVPCELPPPADVS